MTQTTTARKSSDIPDAVFLQAVADTRPSNGAQPQLPSVDSPGALSVAGLIRRACDAGGWEPSTPVRSPYAVYKTLLRAMDVPVKVFYAKARILDDRRGVLNTYDGRWHLASECLDEGCCGAKAAGTRGPLEPVTAEQVAFMQAVLAGEPERRARHATDIAQCDLHTPISLIEPVTKLRAQLLADQAAVRCPTPAPGFQAAYEALRRMSAEAPPPRIGRDPAPRSARSARSGCRFEHGTWIHRPPHTCPAYVRGAR